MEIIALPPILPGTLDLVHVNQRLRAQQIQLDWSAVEDAPDDALATLLWGLDLSDHADALGIGTVPDALSSTLLSMVSKSQTGGKTPRAALGVKPRPLPLSWRPEAPDTLDSGDPQGDTLAELAENIGDASVSIAAEAEPPAVGSAEDQPILQAPSPSQLRDELERMVLADLLGPAGGPEEEVDERSVSDRYLVGMLAPQRRLVPQEEQDELAVAGGDAPDETPADVSAPQAPTFLPSSLGLTCSISGEATSLRIGAAWGRYERITSVTLTDPKSGAHKRVWKRYPMGGVIEDVALREGPLGPWSPDSAQSEVTVAGTVRRLGGVWIVTLFLVNRQAEPKTNSDSAWLFQPELTVEASDRSPVFCGYSAERRQTGRDAVTYAEERAMDMLYRRYVEFAVGHGASVHAELAPGMTERAIRLVTRAVPSYEVPQTTSPTEIEIPSVNASTLDMSELAATADADLTAALLPLVEEYAAWIARQRASITNPAAHLEQYRDTAEQAMTSCDDTLERMREGIALLARDRHAAEAFRFMNRAMWQQRIHTQAAHAARHGAASDIAAFDLPKHRTWRPFQLAFILINLAGITDLSHPDRSAAPSATADLLWFPTGGGKTEAYLGLTAYTLGLRRLQGTIAGRSGEEGVAVLMRYTLRLLTLQQFQRAAALICACEVIRREAAQQGNRHWGSVPFRLGLWVGQRTTPNWTEQSAEAIKLSRGQYQQSSAIGGSGSPAQLTNCPWCGTAIDAGRHIKVESAGQGAGRTYIYCGDPLGQCPFSERQAPGEGLPVLVVDEEIYRRLPSLLIATVDKFAQMPWNGAVQMLFGQVNGYCPRHGFRSPEIEDSASHPRRGTWPAVQTEPRTALRPPDLIIQDELHLISGPLGTLVGLYESAVDRLTTWEVDGRHVRPKVIASTATIRRAADQMHALFLRRVNVFPPHGLDVEDNFFSRQRPPSDELPGRRYLGICAPGRRLKSALIRVYVAYLAASQALYERYGRAADPWMTLVGYFNSMRELAGMHRLVDDDVRARLGKTNERGLARRQTHVVAELTSRRASTDIPNILDQLETIFDPIEDAKRIAARKQGKRFDHMPPLDVLLATNMISVGVDVQRLGLMVVAGQPKTTAEYIQATSRIGRSFPGLVCTVFNWARPRDLSHFEQFEHYHATFYKHVEALSVTPFAPRAIDRGLTALLVSYIRLLGTEFSE
ncbi:MAG TPA: DISARM system helicase DrmA, partial [Ktedonobacterales bacterium]|nr:DISARM system helicase DrmA [Ktedonobacterales bacterium]